MLNTNKTAKHTFHLFTNRTETAVLFSVMSVCDYVCLSVDTITPERLEISSQTFHSIIENGYISVQCADGDRFNVPNVPRGFCNHRL